MKEIGVREIDVLFIDHVFLVLNNPRLPRHLHGSFHFGKGGLKNGCDPDACIISFVGLGATIKAIFHYHARNPASVLLEGVVAQLVPDVQRDQHAAGQADRETKYVYEGESFILNQISESSFKIILKHNFLNVLLQ